MEHVCASAGSSWLVKWLSQCACRRSAATSSLHTGHGVGSLILPSVAQCARLLKQTCSLLASAQEMEMCERSYELCGARHHAVACVTSELCFHKCSSQPRASKTPASCVYYVRSMDAEYLRRTAGSELAQACAAAACQRPDNAVEFLATWLHGCAP